MFSTPRPEPIPSYLIFTPVCFSYSEAQYSIAGLMAVEPLPVIVVLTEGGVPDGPVPDELEGGVLCRPVRVGHHQISPVRTMMMPVAVPIRMGLMDRAVPGGTGLVACCLSGDGRGAVGSGNSGCCRGTVGGGTAGRFSVSFR